MRRQVLTNTFAIVEIKFYQQCHQVKGTGYSSPNEDRIYKPRVFVLLTRKRQHTNYYHMISKNSVYLLPFASKQKTNQNRKPEMRESLNLSPSLTPIIKKYRSIQGTTQKNKKIKTLRKILCFNKPVPSNEHLIHRGLWNFQSMLVSSNSNLPGYFSNAINRTHSILKSFLYCETASSNMQYEMSKEITNIYFYFFLIFFKISIL